MARKPSHLGSYRKPSPAGSVSAAFASIGSMGGEMTKFGVKNRHMVRLKPDPTQQVVQQALRYPRTNLRRASIRVSSSSGDVSRNRGGRKRASLHSFTATRSMYSS